ncbi:MAG: 4Fe-4S binding protein [Methanobacteriaceae archaeon]|nr:4Fe-4S binding protein [Methanobacteriaceae archaeon]
MIIKDWCLYCGECAGVCAFEAITVHEVKIEIDDEKCTNCGVCIKACPVNALESED